MPAITRAVTVWSIASVVSASLMTLMGLPAGALPLVLVLTAALAAYAFRDLAFGADASRLSALELGCLGLALLVGFLRLVPYAGQYLTGSLSGAVTWDDHWHFQEVASLVNAARFPPDLNFQPGTAFHFYYVPWIPAAALSVLAEAISGRSLIKATYALDALALDLAAVWVLLMFLRHAVPAGARAWALGAVMIAGAAPDGIFATLNFLSERSLAHVEWWQTTLGVRNQVSALTTSLVWVPHHLIAGAALLLAVIVATEPGTLAPRNDAKASVAAGLLIAFSAFSSIFACIGGLIALSPLLADLMRAEHRTKLGWLALSAIGAGIPLAYIYVNSGAAGGFVVGQAFTAWRGDGGSAVAGLAGIAVALLLMLLEVGWLFIGAIAARGRSQSESETRLARMALASFLFLGSTALIGFSGSNNWAMRGAIAPAIVLACFWASSVSERCANAAHARLNLRIATGALLLAMVAHLNELALLLGSSVAAPAYAAETAACKAVIRSINDSARVAPSTLYSTDCRDKLSAYHVERRFTKPALSAEDRELMGRGPIRWR